AHPLRWHWPGCGAQKIRINHGRILRCSTQSSTLVIYGNSVSSVLLMILIGANSVSSLVMRSVWASTVVLFWDLANASAAVSSGYSLKFLRAFTLLEAFCAGVHS